MKSKYLMFIFLGFLVVFACNKEDDLFDMLSESDHEALEGMEEAFEAATRYNDSLTICINDFTSCDSVRMWHYDDMFHQFDEMFDHHHGEYSHNNHDDDHHHNDGHTIWHGGMMGHGDGHDDGGSDDDEHEYEHNNETFEAMRHLREMHDEIHPE